MIDLEHEFITQCFISSASKHNQNEIIQVYKNLQRMNKLKKEKLEQIKQKLKLQVSKDQLENGPNEQQIEQEVQIKKQLHIMIENDSHSLRLRQSQVNSLYYQLKHYDQLFNRIPDEYEEIRRIKMKAYQQYQDQKEDLEELAKKQEDQLIDKQEFIDKLNRQIASDQLEFQKMHTAIYEAEKTIKIQGIQISQLDVYKQSVLEEIKDQRQTVCQLLVLQKLERMFLNYEENINDCLQQECDIKLSSHHLIMDFTDNHPFGVDVLITDLINCYNRMKLQLDSATSQEKELLHYKIELIDNYKELEKISQSYHLYEETEIDLGNTNYQTLQSNYSVHQSQSAFKLGILKKIEAFIIKIFNNLVNVIRKFNDIFKNFDLQRMHIDKKALAVGKRFNEFCKEFEPQNQILTARQFKDIYGSQDQGIFIQIQQSQLLKLFVTQNTLVQHYQNKDDILKIYNQTIYYFQISIQRAIDLIKLITSMPKRSKMRSLESQKQLIKPYTLKPHPQISLDLSSKRISIKTSETEIKLQLTRQRTTKRNSFTSTLQSSRKIIPDLESKYLESERQRIKYPQQNQSEHIKILSPQQKHCQLLAESERGMDKREIVKNYKSLLEMRQKRKNVKRWVFKIDNQ